MGGQSLVCPGCGGSHPPSARLCPACGMPLVAGGPPVADSERRSRARKIRRQYAEGELVRVAGGRNQAEAEFIQGLLLEEGVPSLLRRSRGFDVPDFLAAGPRDVLVPRSGAPAAREVLLSAQLAESPGDAVVSPLRLGAGLAAGLGLVALAAWAGTELLG
jgi:hypothetical protein